MPDIVIHNGTIVTMNNSFETIADGWLAVVGERIVDLGGGDHPQGDPRTRFIDAQGGLVLPGLINCHTHAAMTYLRGLADDLPLMQWLQEFIFPVEARSSGEIVYWGTLLACAEMIRSGTTMFCDMYLFEREAARAAKEAGMRALVGEVLYDFDSPNYGKIENGFAYTRDLIDEWKGDPLVSIAVEPHAPYTCSPDLFRTADALARDNGVPLITHLCESEDEICTVVERYGVKPVDHLEELGVLGPHVIADHCVHVTMEEIDTLAALGVRVAHNPESNLKLAVGIAPVCDMLQKGMAVGLGTDGCASNNNLNMFEEMDTAAKLHKMARRDPTVMDAKTVLAMATIGAAKTLGVADQTGSLEPGKLADVIVLDVNRPHLTPFYSPYSAAVYSANGSEVTTSVIQGRVVMEEGRLTTLDEERVMARVREIGRDTLAIIGK